MKVLLYCTKQPPYLYQGFAKPMHAKDTTNPFNYKWHLLKRTKTSASLNGKIVAECDFEVEEIKRTNTVGDWFCYENQDEIMEKSKLDVNEFFDYLQGKNGYAIHIKNLHIFDEPRELSNYYSENDTSLSPIAKNLRKAPQNMMYVYDEWRVLMGNIIYDKYILISIRPQWLCKILNGEKTIEVRKKVLKEMLKNEIHKN